MYLAYIGQILVLTVVLARLPELLRTPRRLLPAGLALLPALLPLAGFAWQVVPRYRAAAEHLGATRGDADVWAWGATLASFADPGERSLWGRVWQAGPGRAEDALFFGVGPSLLVLAAVALLGWRLWRPRRSPVLVRWLAGGGLVCAAVAVWLGDRQTLGWAVPGLDPAGLESDGRWLAAGLLLLGFALALGCAVAMAWARSPRASGAPGRGVGETGRAGSLRSAVSPADDARSSNEGSPRISEETGDEGGEESRGEELDGETRPFRWALAAATLLCLALSFPWFYLAFRGWVPGLDGMRVTARFHALASLGLAVAAGWAAERLLARVPRPALRSALAALLLVGLAAELRPIRVDWSPLHPPGRRPVDRWLAVATDVRALAEVPIKDDTGEIGRMYAALFHHRPLFNGYSGYFPAAYLALRPHLANLPGGGQLDRLASLGVTHLVVHHDEIWGERSAERRQAWRQAIVRARRPRLALVWRDGPTEVYRILPPARRGGPQRPATGVDAATHPAPGASAPVGDRRLARPGRPASPADDSWRYVRLPAPLAASSPPER